MRTRVITGSAAELHAVPLPTVDQPTANDEAELWVMQPTAPALVMGSSQKPEQFDTKRLADEGIELAGRRSGGGAVFIEPASTVWIDLLAPRSSPWWSADLAENFVLVGEVWRRALSSLGIETDMCSEAPTRTDAATLACWAGVGWGELTIDGAKVLGLSQRRTRWGSRVQAMAVLDDSSTRAADYFVSGERPTIPHTTLDIDRPALEMAVLANF